MKQELYVTSTKRQKMAISRSIVEAVRSLEPPGRFLEKNPDTGLWSDIGDKKAIEKVCLLFCPVTRTLPRRHLQHEIGTVTCFMNSRSLTHLSCLSLS